MTMSQLHMGAGDSSDIRDFIKNGRLTLLKLFMAAGNIVNAALSISIFYKIVIAGKVTLIEANPLIAFCELILSVMLLMFNFWWAATKLFKKT